MKKALLLLIIAACATGRIDRRPAPLRADGPAHGHLTLYVSQQLPTGAMASFGFRVEDGYAVLGQVTDGRVRILFPAPDNPTGRVRGDQRRHMGIDTTLGPVYLVAGDEPMHLGTVQDAAGFVDWRSTEPISAADPDTVIQRFASAVAAIDATILRPARREYHRRAPLPHDVRQVVQRQGLSHGTCRTAPSHTKGGVQCIP